MGAWLNVLVLAVVQGLTEFLPVSSSGHLMIGKQLLGLDSPGVRLEVVLHAGTLAAVCAYFWRRLWSLAMGAFKGEKAAWWMIGFLALATFPALVAFKLFGKPLNAALTDSRTGAMIAAWGLLATGAMLLSLRWVRTEHGFSNPSDMQAGLESPGSCRGITLWRALLMGIGQAVAILPGVSRSGTTVTVGRHSGAAREVVGEFAMLMSIPIILGAALADALGAELGSAESAVTPAMYAVGALVSAVVGYAAIGIFMRVIKSAWFWVFGVYCLVAGCVALAVL